MYRLVLDPNTNSPIVVLQDEASGALLPIWIGMFEAHSIAMKLEGVQPARPMTHDLISNLLATVQGLVERIEVTDLVDNTYYARIHFQMADRAYSLDSRPSDAIALALRTTSPIYVANHVLDKSKIEPADGGGEPAPEGESEQERWQRILKNFSPDKPDKIN